MTRVRMSVAIAKAIPFAPVAGEATAPASPPDAAASSSPDGDGIDRLAARSPHDAQPAPTPQARRGGLRAWLRRPADYARAFLTASVEHQLRQQAARAVDTGGAVARIEGAVQHAHAALAHGQAHAHALALAHNHAQASRLEDLSAQLVRVSDGLDALARRFGVVQERQESLALLLAEQERQRRAAEAEQERSRSAVEADQMALARRGVAASDHAVARLDEVLGVLGPRFDELEIKVRPLVEVDAESVAVRTADGYVMLPRSEPLFVAAVANATSGGLEPGVRRVLRALLRPGDACADVGANVGLLTVAMGYAVGQAGCVWAFEPEARVRAQLARTLHLNGLAQVRLSGAAVGARPERLVLHQSPIIGHSSLYALPDEEQAQARTVEVEVVRLDDVVPSGTALAAVKIDVEGAELDVLAGMSRVLADSADIAVVAEFGPVHLRRVGIAADAWFAAFAAHGLVPRLITEPGGATAKIEPGELLEVDSANLVFVRPGGAADGRLPR